MAGPADPAWRRNKEIVGNAATLVAAAGVSALLGFAFWAIAARLFSPADIGYASATTSAMTLLGTIGMFGLGSILMSELPKRATRANLIATVLLAAGIGSSAIGLAFVLVAPHLSVNFRNSIGTLSTALIFVIGVMLTAVTYLFDQASIGLLRGGLQLFRNFALALAKLLVLPAAAYVLDNKFGGGIALAWVASSAISLMPVALWLSLRGTKLLVRPDWRLLRALRRSVVKYNWLSVALIAPTTLTPILVTVLVSPFANGAFYAAWMMVSMLYLIPGNLSTVLFTVVSGDPKALARKLRFTLGLSYLIGLPGMAALGLGGRYVLEIFGPVYVHEALLPLSLLVIAYIPIVPRTHYLAVCQAANRIPRAATVMTIAALVEVAAIVMGARWNGLVGLSVGLLAARCLTGAALTPAVLKAALGRGRHRFGETFATENVAAIPPGLQVTPTSQHAALALLMMMSTPE